MSSRRNFSALPRAIVFFLLASLLSLVSPDALHAQTCNDPSPPTLSLVSLTGPDDAGWAEITVSYTFPTWVQNRVISVYRNSVHLVHDESAGFSGTSTYRIDLACLDPKSYSIDVYATSCFQYGKPGYSAHAGGAVATSSKPEILSFDVTPNGVGSVLATLHYRFPRTRDRHSREYSISINGAPQIWVQPAEQENTATYTFSTSCWPTGTYTFTAQAVACRKYDDPNFYVREKKSLNVTTKPDVSLSVSAVNDAGFATGTIDYSFPNTPLQSDRDLIVTLPDGSREFIGYEVAGQLTFEIDTRCWKAGSYPITVTAIACHESKEPEFTDTAAQTVTVSPVTSIDVALLKKNVAGQRKIEATIKYAVPRAALNKAVKVEVFSWRDAAGVEHPGFAGPWFVPTEPSGELTWEFDPPSGARQVVVRATAESCVEAKESVAAIDCSECATGNPVFLSDGNMRLYDTDPLPTIGGHTLTRSYDSDEQVVGLFGRGFTTIFDSRLISHGNDDFSVVTPRNEVVLFKRVGNLFRQLWPTARASLGTFTFDSLTNEYSYRANGSTEVARFRASDGRIVALRNLTSGREAQFVYDAAGKLQALQDSWSSLRWDVTVDAQRRVSTIAVNGRPDVIWTYVYAANGNLTGVLSPLGTWRTYDYLNDRMTASYDPSGKLIESHTYDAQGRAITSTGNIDEIANIEYLTSSVPGERITRITENNGAITEQVFRPSGGGWSVVATNGPCGSCGSRNETVVRDERGRVVRRQDARGYVTATTYLGDQLLSRQGPLKTVGCDPEAPSAQCRLDSAALAGAALEPTSATLTLSYEYADTNWPDLPTAVVTNSVLKAGDSRREELSYDPVTGEVKSRRIQGWSVTTNGGAATRIEHTTVTKFYGVDNESTAPAFTPGGSFQSEWSLLPQPARMRKSVDGPRFDVSDVTSFVYYPIDSSIPSELRGRLAAAKNAAGHITRYEAYDVFGNVSRVVDPNGVATTYVYDSLGRVETSTIEDVPSCNTAEDPLCSTDIIVTRTYEPGGGPLSIETGADGDVTVYTYDDRGRMLTTSRGPSAADLRERLEVQYDAGTGQKSLERYLLNVDGTWVEKNKHVYEYNAVRMLKSRTNADGTKVLYGYDAADQLQTIQDENHSTPNTKYFYDPAGRLKRVEQTLATAPNGKAVTSYAYDLAGNLTSVTDPNGNVTTYVYDDFGRMLRQTSPVTGVTTYLYDLAGNLTSTTDSLSTTSARTYDLLGRVESANSTRAGVTEIVTWTYDTGAFGVGRPATMTDPTGTTAYAYDRRGLLRQETRTISGSTYVTGYQYDVEGNRSKIVYPSGRTVTFTYDYANRPKTATAGSTPLVTDAQYLPFGPMTKLVYGNGTTKQMTFDSRYRLDTSQLSTATQSLASYDYGYDAAGNITSIADLLDSAYNRSFQYDDLNRLTVANSGSALWGSGSYSYDAMGNLLSSTVGSKVFTGYMKDTTPRYNGVVENGVSRYLGYDAAGNERSVGDQMFHYNTRNQLASTGAFRYGYDGRGVRVSTTVEGGCPLTVNLAPGSFSDAGGAGRVDVAALPDCVWTAVSSASWLTIGTQTAGSISFQVAPNSGTTVRTATITVGEQSVTVSQSGMTSGSDGSDVNGNGGAEIVARGSRTGQVLVRTTNGLSASSAAIVSTVSDLQWKLVGSGDFDGDGDSDLLWRHGWTGEVAIHTMQNGAIASVTTAYTEASRAWRVSAVGDVSGDGKADILSRNEATGAVVERLMNGTTISTQTTVLTEPDLSWRLVAAGDFNGDGRADLLWRNGRSGAVQLQLRSGTTFGARTAAFTRANLSHVIAGVGDVDLDGKADILMHDLRNGVLEIAYRNGASASTALRTEADTLWSPAQIADYDGNGTADVLWRNSRSGALRSNLLLSGTIAVVADPVSTSDRALRIPNAVRAWGAQAGPRADTLGDGRSDLIWRNTTTGDVAVWQMNGSTIPANESVYRVVESGWEVRAGGDLNRDGRADLIWRRASAGSVAFWYLDGAQLVGSEYLFLDDPEQTSWNLEAAADLSGDGETDLVFRHLTTGMVRVMELTRTSTGWERPFYDVLVTDLNWRIAGVGDFNADGHADLLWWNQTTGQLTIWHMTKGSILLGKVAYNVVLEWKPQRVGDFSGDGRADILWRNSSTGSYSLWEMNGMTLVSSMALPLPNGSTAYAPQPIAGDYNGDGYDDVLLRHTNGDVITWEMAAPTLPTLQSFGNVTSDWVVQRLEPRPQPTAGGSATALATTANDSGNPWWTPADAPPFWSPPTPVRSVSVPRTPGPPFWAPAHGLKGPVPGPPIIPPGLGSSSIGNVVSTDGAPTAARSSSGPSIVLANAVTTSVRHSLYTPELNLLAETALTTGTPSIAYEYVWFAGQPIAQVDVLANTIVYTVTDHLGTPLLQTDAAANVVWRVEYEPYGNVHSYPAGATRHQPLRFPGQEHDELAPERAYNIYRWYRNGWGRYTQADPDWENVILHPYDYANGNATRWADPRGLKAFDMFEVPHRIPSMPGQIPDKKCCSHDEIQKATDSVDYQLDRMIQGKMPRGSVAAMTISPVVCSNGLCSNLPVDPREYVFKKNYSSDPCVNYCVNFHEFLHFTDTRHWDTAWTHTQQTLFQEFFPYLGEKACLMVFGGR